MLTLLGCKNETKSSEKSMNTATRSDKELEGLIIQKGDSSAYYELSMQYLDYGYERFLPYALIMANKYNYSQAYFDVFDCLTYVYVNNATQIDEKTATLAIEYLLEAANKGHAQAKEMIQEYSIKIDSNNKVQIIKIFE